jgi:hypothetical protein
MLDKEALRDGSHRLALQTGIEQNRQEIAIAQ